MASERPIADRVRDEVAAFKRLRRESPLLAAGLIVALLCVAGYWFMDWSGKRERIAKLEIENRDLNADLRQLRTENQGLRETVAPLIKQAMERFPGEEILTALKKVIETLDIADPHGKPIRTATASVTLRSRSSEDINTHFMDSGCYLAFAKGTDPMLMTASLDSFARKSGPEEVTYWAKLQMEDSDRAVGKPVRSLLDAEYIEILCRQLPDAPITGGSATVTVNSEVRLDFDVPAQQPNEKRVFIRDVVSVLNVMKKEVPDLPLQPAGKASGGTADR